MISPRTRQNLWSELRSSRLAQIGVFLVILVFLMALFAPFITPHHPETQRVGTGDALDQTDLPPIGFSTVENQTRLVDGKIVTKQVELNANTSFILGTNTRGQDILSRVIYGGRVSLMVGILGAILATLIGVPYGLFAGYYSGRLDDVMMRGADIMLAFPSLVLAIALVGVFRGTEFHTQEIPDPFVWAAQSDLIPNILIPRAEHVASMPETTTLPVTVTLVVALVNWVWFARIARGEAISIRSQEYVKAARSIGASNLTILRQHVLPNSITPIIVLATIQVAFIILLESALSFLGFSGTTLTWGQDIARGQSDQRAQWWIATMPGLAIVIAVIGVNLVGDWLRDALDPGIEGEAGGV